ncbi:MAG: ATP-binding protein [Candidatus Lindowbacteria bacterium]|nr:ATP-binding protein [Candidatus Lindowbacteria bacterium]
MALERDLGSLQEYDLQELVQNKVPEGKNIEYKRMLPANSDDNKKEFLADVSSFANASGGHLLYGIRAESGIPAEIIGLKGVPDNEKLRSRT